MSDVYDVGSAPAKSAFAITEANADLSVYPRALYVGVAGNVTVMTLAGETVEFVGVPAGSILPVSVKQVRTATTAASIVGLV